MAYGQYSMRVSLACPSLSLPLYSRARDDADQCANALWPRLLLWSGGCHGGCSLHRVCLYFSDYVIAWRERPASNLAQASYLHQIDQTLLLGIHIRLNSRLSILLR